MRRRALLGSVAVAVLVNLFLAAMVAVAFFLTALAYERAGYHPSALLAQVINAVLGSVFTFLVLLSIGAFLGSRRMHAQMGFFGPIIDAMERIAKGDFSVRLDSVAGDNGVFDTLVNSVNTMAIELDQMEAMRQEFISNVSHEIQSPLTSIRGFARALQSDELSPADRAHYLSIIEAESMRLSKLSDNLLALAALEPEQLTFEPRPYRLDRQIRNVILAAEPQWMGKGIDLDVSLDPVTIAADEDLLSQVWINLLHNGIKFTPAGGSVFVRLACHDAQVVFSISDSGIGIAEEDQAHVFERFFKADRSRERAQGGSGLGLAIVQKIVAIHLGTIDVESTPGAGATFTVRLPATMLPPSG
ncbi:MAG: two-component sensor histidine kinase [Kouleothrix sp.]|nr:two-component sensor histidine kinase [Kouleothrix sp.]